MDLENFPTSGSAVKLMEYVTPGWYDKAYIGKWIYQVLGLSLDEVTKLYEEFPEQLFPDTATWGLPYHERKYGLPVNSLLSDEERRRLIRKRQMTRIPMTPYNMEQMIKNVTEFEVHVSDVQDCSKLVKKPGHPNEFQVVLIGEGSADLGAIRKYLDQVKQSHTVYEIFYYEYDGCSTPINYENVISIRGEFNPRFNLERLLLDGLWELNGSYTLNGYKSDSQVDFYPTEVKVQIHADENISGDMEMSVRCPVEALKSKKTEEDSSVQLRFKTEGQKTPDYDGKVSYQDQYSAAARTGQAGITVMRLLDGSWKMDGSRLMNGGKTEL